MGKPLRKRIRHDLGFLAITILILIFQLLSRPAALKLAKLFGRLSFWLGKKDRQRIRENLKFAYESEKSSEELEQIAKDVMFYIAMNAVDALRAPLITKKNIDKIVDIKGFDHFEKAVKLGNGVVAVTPHLGNFELLAAYLSLKGYPINAIAAPLYDERLNDLLIKYREIHGVQNIPRGVAIKEALRCLRRGEVLGVLPDQDTKVSGVFVPFFGKPAHTAIGPASLALKTNAAIVPMAIHLTPDYKHLIEVEPAISLKKTGNKKQDVTENTAKYTEYLEKFIRKNPKQWVWMHRRWRKYQKKLKVTKNE